MPHDAHHFGTATNHSIFKVRRLIGIIAISSLIAP